MKTKFKILLLLFIAAAFAPLATFAQHEDVKAAFNNTFPELNDKNRETTLNGDIDQTKTAMLRDVYSRLELAMDDMSAFKLDSRNPILVVFDKKDLRSKYFKKESEAARLEMVDLLVTNKHAIRDYMADKTQYGMDPSMAQRNMSLFIEFKKQDHFEDAYIPWTYAFLYSPRAHKTIYTTGESILKGLIEATDDAERRENLIDTLMIMYKQRIKYFNEEGSVLGRKGVNLLKYRNTAVAEAYGYLKKSVEMEKEESSEATLVTFMQTASELFKRQEKNEKGELVVTASDVIQNYNLTMGLLESKMAKAAAGDKANIEMAMAGVEQHFSNSGAADCDALIAIYTPQFEKEANKNDTTFLIKTLNQLNKVKCDDSDLHFEISRQLHKLKPSAMSAVGVAKRYFKTKSFDDALTYYNEAVSLCREKERKAEFNYEIALCYKELNQYSKSRDYALEAAQINENYGKPYLLIGVLYASSRSNCGKDDWEKNTVFWVAVDMLVKARTVDPELTSEANKLIASYSSHFPNKEEAFMRSVTAGTPYKVGCWIQRTTTARF